MTDKEVQNKLNAEEVSITTTEVSPSVVDEYRKKYFPSYKRVRSEALRKRPYDRVDKRTKKRSPAKDKRYIVFPDACYKTIMETYKISRASLRNYIRRFLGQPHKLTPMQMVVVNAFIREVEEYNARIEKLNKKKNLLLKPVYKKRRLK